MPTVAPMSVRPINQYGAYLVNNIITHPTANASNNSINESYLVIVSPSSIV